MNELTLSRAINTALHDSMIKDDKVICFGLGVGDPKEIFGTTAGLIEKFGNDIVYTDHRLLEEDLGDTLRDEYGHIGRRALRTALARRGPAILADERER